jgi:hypothetical protein
LKPDAAAGTEPLETLERFRSAFADRDAEAMMRLLVPDPEVVVITITTTAGCLGRSTVPQRTDQSAASRWKRSSTPRLARCSLRTKGTPLAGRRVALLLVARSDTIAGFLAWADEEPEPCVASTDPDAWT